ncbi:hypothetical protein [Enterococcus sp. AZ177]|uniref:hypothetical protein n=1 Tax=unclassified Enterococcus TaxID=2608891 RepID=UPI003D30126F
MKSFLSLKEKFTFFASGEPHYFLALPDSERIVYQVDLNVFDEFNLKSVDDGSLIELVENRGKAQFKIVEISCFGYKSDFYFCPTPSLLFQLVATFYRKLPQTKTDVKKGAKPSILKYKENLEHLDKIFTYGENHYEEPIVLEEIAEYSGFSSYYFTRFLRPIRVPPLCVFLWKIDSIKQNLF